MKPAPRPQNDCERLDALKRTELWQTYAEPGFDDLVILTATLFQVPICIVSLVGEDTQWYKATVGMASCESDRDISFCGHTVAQNKLLVIENAKTDPRFHDNPYVTQQPNVVFYAGAPVHDLDTGLPLGALCIIDHEPRKFSEEEGLSLLRLAAQVSDQIRLRRLVKQVSVLNQQLRAEQSCLVREVDRRTDQLKQTRQEVINCLARAGEHRDDDTGLHVKRVSLYVKEIAEELGFTADACDAISQASVLHDVGKIGIPDAILLKPGRLSNAEFDVVKTHTTKGALIIKSIHESEAGEHSDQGIVDMTASGEIEFDVLKMAARIAISHHERFDGNGYPNGITGTDIPLEGRILAVADVYDALSSERVYKSAMDTETCRRILEEGRGTHFDPAVLDAFFARFDRILTIRKTWTQPASGFWANGQSAA